MPRLLAAIVEPLGPGGVEEDHRLGRHRAVLGAAQAEGIDTRPPGQIGRRTAQGGHRIREPRPVHVDRQARLMRDARQGRDLLRRIDGAPFGRIGDRDQRVQTAIQPRARADMDGLRQGVGAQLAALARQCDQLGPVGKELGRGAFAGLDMRVVMAIDPPPGGRQLRADQRIGRRAGGHEPHHRLGRLQQIADRGLGAGGHRIGAIAHHRARIGLRQGGQNGGMGGIGVVRCEIHDRSSMIWSSQSSSVTVNSLTVQPRTLTPAWWTVSVEPEIR